MFFEYGWLRKEGSGTLSLSLTSTDHDMNTQEYKEFRKITDFLFHCIMIILGGAATALAMAIIALKNQMGAEIFFCAPAVVYGMTALVVMKYYKKKRP